MTTLLLKTAMDKAGIYTRKLAKLCTAAASYTPITTLFSHIVRSGMIAAWGI